MFSFTRVTLTRQFQLVSFLILVTGMLVIGLWVGRQIEAGITNHTGAVTALYMDSFVAPHLQSLAHGDNVEMADLQQLDLLLTDTPLGQQIVSFKVWAPDGRVLYSTNPELIGRRFPMTAGLVRAFAGEVHTHISDLVEPEHEYERRDWSRLIETYAPVRAQKSGTILAVSEFYQTTEALAQEIRAAQWRSWLVVSAATLVMYALLTGLVGRASQTIHAQRAQLQEKVAQLTGLLAQNERLHERIRRAAARTTALNERFLRRISADLHDGPGQDLALALLRIEALTEGCQRCPIPLSTGRSVRDDFDTVRCAMQAALTEIRSISAGLRLPEMDKLSLGETARRAVRDYERKTSRQVTLDCHDLPKNVPLPLKIILYRLLQESLANSYRHAAASEQQVEINSSEEGVIAIISDNGSGFDPQAVSTNGHLGLVGMRERVQILGGTFAVNSRLGGGTVIQAWLPLTVEEADLE